MDTKLFNTFYKECKKITCDELKLSDCRLIAIIQGLKFGSVIPLASANYADGDTLKKTSVSLDALKRISFALRDFAIGIEPIAKTDAEGKKYIAYKTFDLSKWDSSLLNDAKFFSAKVLKGDTKRPSSASSGSASSGSASSGSASSGSASSGSASGSASSASGSASDDKENKVISIVGKLSDYVKNNLKVTNEQLAKLESEFMKILDNSI